MTEPLTEDERTYLLKLAREAIRCAVEERRALELDEATVPPGRLRELGASFVTLTIDGGLRGCTGSIEPREPLAQNVLRSAVTSALYDYRFEPVSAPELALIAIEISVLTPPASYVPASPEALLAHLAERRPGVILEQGFHRATFLPQVWEKLPDPEEFLEHLCAKAGLRLNAWREREMEFQLYDVEMLEEHRA
jgi:AmmeMemoRadiSam system protein A